MASNNIIFPVSLLYIQLDVNVDGEDKKKPNIHLFKSSMLKMPKMNTMPLLTSEFPFFTKNVRYPASIENADWKVKYQFFFNRPLFVERLRQEIEDNPSIYRDRLTPKKDASEEENTELYKWMIETEKHNIMVTLRALFPIPEYFGKALKDSYRNVLMNKPNARILTDLSIRNAVNVFGFMYKFGIASKEKEEYFINIGGKRFIVNDVIWKNDIINHPVYSQFLASQRETYEEVNTSAEDVEEKYNAYLQKLNDELNVLKTSESRQKEFYKTINDCNQDDAKCKSSMFEYFKKTIKKLDKKTFDERFPYADKSKYPLDNLKAETLFMMQQHILLKVNSATVNSRYNINIDRINTANAVADKLEILSNETGESAVDIILSIREDFDNHRLLHSGEGINIFMEREYELGFERLLKMAIETKAASIVLRFAKNNIPMNLADKKPDGSEISQLNKRINQHIRDFFVTEANINNRLLSNVNAVFEPVRKTSNRELYKVLKMFKFGDEIIKREYKMEDAEIEEKRRVLENAYDKFVQNKKINTEKIEQYLYTGVDEVKSSADDKNSNLNSIVRNVYEVYVGMDLVNAEFYEKGSNSSCRLTDKEMEQGLYYLLDPRIKTDTVPNNYRDFSFEKEDVAEGEKKKEKKEEKGEETKQPKETKNTGGKYSRRIRPIRLNRTKRN